MKAFGTHVIVKVRKTKKVTEGGIHLPDGVNEEDLNFGDVISIGPKVEDSEMLVGKCVAYKRYSGDKLTHEGEEYAAVSDMSILFIL